MRYSFPRALAIAACTLLLSILSAEIALGQNVSLKGTLSPFPGPLRYADVWGEGNYAYLASYNGTGIMIIDISDPAIPFLAGYYNRPRAADSRMSW
jgi:hypothetical protein